MNTMIKRIYREIRTNYIKTITVDATVEIWDEIDKAIDSIEKLDTNNEIIEFAIPECDITNGILNDKFCLLCITKNEDASDDFIYKLSIFDTKPNLYILFKNKEFERKLNNSLDIPWIILKKRS